MNQRERVHSALLLGAATGVLLGMIGVSLEGQDRRGWVPPRTSWGDPDLTGIWPTTTMVGVPLERDPALGTRNTLNDDEFARRQKLAEEQLALDNADFDVQDARPAAGPELALRASGQVVDNPLAPAPHWLELGRPSRQASLIVDPPDGRLPTMTVGGERRAAALSARRAKPMRLADRTLYSRCISRGVIGSVLPMIADSGNQILQAPGYVVIRHEMIHDTRIIPLDGRPHVSGKIRGYLGDSRGRWEGNTLVVETTNIAGDLGIAVNGGGTPLSSATRFIERFTRTSEDELQYELTVDDAETWVRPWTIAFPWQRDEKHTLFEFSCHEGNRSLRNILTGELATVVD